MAKYNNEPLPPLTLADIPHDAAARLAANMVGQCIDDLDMFARNLDRYHITTVEKFRKTLRKRWPSNSPTQGDTVKHPITYPYRNALSAWAWLTEESNYFRDLLMQAMDMHQKNLKDMAYGRYGHLEVYLAI